MLGGPLNSEEVVSTGFLPMDRRPEEKNAHKHQVPRYLLSHFSWQVDFEQPCPLMVFREHSQAGLTLKSSPKSSDQRTLGNTQALTSSELWC